METWRPRSPRWSPAPRLVHVDPRLAQTAALDLLDPDPARAAAGLLAAAREVWRAEYMGPVWARAVGLITEALAASPAHTSPATLADVERFVTDPAWRTKLINAIPQGRLRADLDHESHAWDSSTSGNEGPTFVQYLSAKFAPLTRGPGASLFSAAPKQPLEEHLRRGAVIVIALPLGSLGTETTSLAARMFLSRLITAIAAQGDLPIDQRRQISVYLDEAHLMAGNALGGLFAQARKFNTAVHACVQAPSMLGSHLDEILTNTGTHLLGRLNAAQAQHLVDRAGPTTADMLPGLPRFHAILLDEDHDPTQSPIVLSPLPLPKAVRPAGVSE